MRIFVFTHNSFLPSFTLFHNLKKKKIISQKEKLNIKRFTEKIIRTAIGFSLLPPDIPLITIYQVLVCTLRTP